MHISQRWFSDLRFINGVKRHPPETIASHLTTRLQICKSRSTEVKFEPFVFLQQVDFIVYQKHKSKDTTFTIC